MTELIADCLERPIAQRLADDTIDVDHVGREIYILCRYGPICQWQP